MLARGGWGGGGNNIIKGALFADSCFYGRHTVLGDIGRNTATDIPLQWQNPTNHMCDALRLLWLGRSWCTFLRCLLKPCCSSANNPRP